MPGDRTKVAFGFASTRKADGDPMEMPPPKMIPSCSCRSLRPFVMSDFLVEHCSSVPFEAVCIQDKILSLSSVEWVYSSGF